MEEEYISSITNEQKNTTPKKNSEHKQRKNYFGKAIVGITIFTTGLFLGDKIDTNREFFEPLRYFKKPVAQQCPQDYWNYTTKVELENDEIMLYFGNKETNEYRLVRKNGLVGTICDNLENIIAEVSKDSGFSQTKESITKKVKEWTKKEEGQ
ncbi:MAG: hypothetical protein ABIC91_04740 [Nanoarchaeota archaeon]|nr:hypothetical protein [Nanoarchaeota archaeon]MBU1030682.1 hypothetical protein [Nanoarchaeota archaeon]MBU1849341.1 hypothetical protein [Nanoarchaeota archaeon]